MQRVVFLQMQHVYGEFVLVLADAATLDGAALVDEFAVETAFQGLPAGQYLHVHLECQLPVGVIALDAQSECALIGACLLHVGNAEVHGVRLLPLRRFHVFIAAEHLLAVTTAHCQRHPEQ